MDRGLLVSVAVCRNFHSGLHIVVQLNGELLLGFHLDPDDHLAPSPKIDLGLKKGMATLSIRGFGLLLMFSFILSKIIILVLLDSFLLSRDQLNRSLLIGSHQPSCNLHHQWVPP